MEERTTLPWQLTTDADNRFHENHSVLTSLAVIECVLMIVGVFGNIMLFILMRSKKLSQYSFAVYFSFAAVFDSLTIFWNSFEDAYSRAHLSEVEEDAARSYTFVCGLMELADEWFANTAPLIKVWLAVDRYISICHPNAAQICCRRSIAKVVCFVSVVFGFLLGLPWSLIIPDNADNDASAGPVLCGDEGSYDDIDTAEEILTLFLPTLALLVCNFLILIRLSEKKAFRDEDSLTEFGKEQNKKNRINRTMFYVLVTTALTWLPHSIVTFTEIVNPSLDNNGSTQASIKFDYAWHVTLILWLFAFVQDFYVMMIVSPVYRKEMRRQCACLPWFQNVEYDRVDINADRSANQLNSDDED